MTVELRLHWDGDPTSWTTFSSHELTPSYRVHWSSTTWLAPPTAEVTVGGSRFDLGTLQQSFIQANRAWIKYDKTP
jgi:hypothetical protein